MGKLMTATVSQIVAFALWVAIITVCWKASWIGGLCVLVFAVVFNLAWHFKEKVRSIGGKG